MQTVVLAAGEGTRMRPLSDRRPKPLLPVGDRPLVEHALEAAVEAGTEELVLVVGYHGEAIRSRVGETYRDVPVRYVDQPEPAGTADAVARASDHLSGPFAVLNGDNLYDPAGIDRLFAAGPAIGVSRVDDPSAYGVVSTAGDRVTGIVEKPTDPPTALANAGAYVFPAEARGWLDVPESERGEREITDVVSRASEVAAVTPVELDRWLDVGRPWELLAANEFVLSSLEGRVQGDVSERAEVGDDVTVEAGATVRPGAVVEGPTLIRSGATVGPNAYVRGASLIGPSAHVGHAVEVKNSVLCADATVGHLTYVGDSVIGRDVNLGAGTIVANLRHDDEPIAHTVKGERVSTGRRKFGVVVGDGVKTGIDTSLAPGVTLSTGVRTAPGETVSRDR